MRIVLRSALFTFFVCCPTVARAQVDTVFANSYEENPYCSNDGTGSFACGNVSGDADSSTGVAAVSTLILTDGSESGDTPVWSSTTP